jgi:hypothetical protein
VLFYFITKAFAALFFIAGFFYGTAGERANGAEHIQP